MKPKYRRTVVLMWNPGISSVKTADFDRWFDSLCTFDEEFLNWSVWDYKKVGYGDRFVLVRVGDGLGGIVAEGLVSSDCYEGKDWAGTAHTRRYADLVAMRAYNAGRGAVMPTTAQLQQAVPDFDWSGGHSGRVLTRGQADRLDAFLTAFEEENAGLMTDVSKVRLRDYLVDPKEIRPTLKQQRQFGDTDLRPVIDALVRQALGINPGDLEAKWHKVMGGFDHKALLQTAARMAYPLRKQLPYYGALCLKVSIVNFGAGNQTVRAAYAKEAMDRLEDPELRMHAVDLWLDGSLGAHLWRGAGHALDPYVRDRVQGLDALNRFIGGDAARMQDMLHDYSVLSVDTDLEHDRIKVTVGHDSEDEYFDDDGNPVEEWPGKDCSEVLVFTLTDGVEIKADCGARGCNYIYGAYICRAPGGKMQLSFDGYGLKVSANNISVSIRRK